MNENDMLLKVYIGQEVNYSRGILYRLKNDPLFDENETKIINSLVGKSLIAEKQPYTVKSIITLVTTRRGKEEARNLIDQILKSTPTLIEEISKIPKRVLGFLLLNLDDNSFEKSREEFYFDWKEFILNRTKIFDYALQLCSILEKYNLAVSTHDYVSSNGGRIDPEKYVIPDEVTDYIIKNLSLSPFTNEENKQALLFYTLFTIEDDILPIKDEERRRNSYWNLLRRLPFGESAIKSLVSQFQKENITTEYLEIGNERFLFSVLDESRFRIKLEKMLDEFVSGTMEGKRAELEPISKPSELLRTHSELFETIGNFEMRFREGLIKEMRTVYKENKYEWYNQLKEIKTVDEESAFKTMYDKLESRKADDVRNKILPEAELIYYADIVDYKDIILKNWTLFENRFNRIDIDKEKFEHGMNELNKIRRKVMHIRDVRPFESKTLRLYITPELEKIFS